MPSISVIVEGIPFYVEVKLVICMGYKQCFANNGLNFKPSKYIWHLNSKLILALNYP